LRSKNLLLLNFSTHKLWINEQKTGYQFCFSMIRLTANYISDLKVSTISMPSLNLICAMRKATIASFAKSFNPSKININT